MGPLSPDKTWSLIGRVRELAPGLPFGIGTTLLMPGAADNAEVALEEEVPLIRISLGRGDWVAEADRSYGRKVFATVTNASHAEKALFAGVDDLIVTVHEAGAHGGGRQVCRADTGACVAIP